jgi:hypothetical protein
MSFLILLITASPYVDDEGKGIWRCEAVRRNQIIKLSEPQQQYVLSRQRQKYYAYLLADNVLLFCFKNPLISFNRGESTIQP